MILPLTHNNLLVSALSLHYKERRHILHNATQLLTEVHDLNSCAGRLFSGNPAKLLDYLHLIDETESVDESTREHKGVLRGKRPIGPLVLTHLPRGESNQGTTWHPYTLISSRVYLLKRRPEYYRFRFHALNIPAPHDLSFPLVWLGPSID